MFWPPSYWTQPPGRVPWLDGYQGDGPDGWCDPRRDDRQVDRYERHGLPATGVMAGQVRPRLPQAQVDDAAVVQVGEQDLAGRGHPALVGHDPPRRAVRQVDLELGEQRQLAPVHAAVVLRIPAQAPAIPAVAEGGDDHVGPGSEQRGDVVRLGQQTMVVGRPAGRQQVLADRVAVDAHVVEPE